MPDFFQYDAPQDLLNGKTILVSGAGSGIGRAASLAYAHHGATVILLGSRTNKLEQTYDLIEAAGGQAAIYTLDLLSEQQEVYQQLADLVEEEFGSLDGLLHNASLLGERKPLASQTPSIWRDVFQVNVHAAMQLNRALLPLLQLAENASIVFSSSSVGRTGRAYWGAYAASKFATEGMMETLADELANTSSVRVNSLNPGATHTEMRKAAYPGEDPLANPEPEDIMPIYLYLMGADSESETGKAWNARR